MAKSLTPKMNAVKVLVLVGVAVLVTSGVAWWKYVYTSPTYVFNRMLANSLSSPSVAKQTSQKGDFQTLNQTSVLMTEPEQRVHSVSVLEQGEDSDTVITTESIASPEFDYVRYVDIATTQKNSSGNEFDFSSVMGLWGKSNEADSAGNGAQLFNQTILGVVPVANLSLAQRTSLLNQIKKDNVFSFDSAAIKRSTINGRPVYSYEVTIKPVAYVTMLKQFARSIGLTQLEQVDPSQYANSAPLNFTFEIDVWSGQLTKIIYENSARTEAFTSYGVRSQIELPLTSIGVDELQARLSQIQ